MVRKCVFSGNRAVVELGLFGGRRTFVLEASWFGFLVAERACGAEVGVRVAELSLDRLVDVLGFLLDGWADPIRWCFLSAHGACISFSCMLFYFIVSTARWFWLSTKVKSGDVI